MGVREITLEDIPPPGMGRVVVEYHPDMYDILMKRCEELGWTFGARRKPTAVGQRLDGFLYFGHPSPNQLRFGSQFYPRYQFERCKLVTAKPIRAAGDTCPLCGSSGCSMAVSFCCSNSGCRNFRE